MRTVILSTLMIATIALPVQANSNPREDALQYVKGIAQQMPENQLIMSALNANPDLPYTYATEYCNRRRDGDAPTVAYFDTLAWNRQLLKNKGFSEVEAKPYIDIALFGTYYAVDKDCNQVR
jgi:hypothetical protein